MALNLPYFFYSKRAKALRALTHIEAWNAQETRDQQLEYWLKDLVNAAGTGGGSTVAVGSFPADPIYVSSTTPYVFTTDVTVDHGIILLRTSGSTSSIVDAYKNGVIFWTGTITSGLTITSPDPFTPTFFTAYTDVLLFAVSTAGTSATGLTSIIYGA